MDRIISAESLSLLPIELLDKIATINELTYRAMLGIPRFARSLTPGRIVDFMIGFGYGVLITNRRILWYRTGVYFHHPNNRYQNGSYLHRRNGPAIEDIYGSRHWLQKDDYYFDACGYIPAKAWCQNGLYHRDPFADGTVGPAIEWSNGVKNYYQRGYLHRDPSPDGTIGPAIECPEGFHQWFRHGKYHGDGGPAIFRYDGTGQDWVQNGIRVDPPQKIE